MRLSIAAGLALALVVGTPALAAAQDDLVAKRDKKLAEPFLKKADWITDFDEAKAAAKNDGKLIFAYFTRSYAY